MEMDKQQSAKREHQLRVPVHAGEAHAIKVLAAHAGLSVAAYLRNVGLGYPLRCMLDHAGVEELARLHAELERVARLLALWLADDPRAARFDAATIRAVLSKLETTQRQMHDVMRAVVRPRSKR